MLPEHSSTQKDEVIIRISTLKTLLGELEQSYLDNAPSDMTSPVDPEYIAAAGHS